MKKSNCKNNDILQKAIDTYGKKAQVLKTCEELSELTHALVRALVELDMCARNRKETIDNVLEEMADVEIMLEQCKMMFDCDSKVKQWKYKKIKRL